MTENNKVVIKINYKDSSKLETTNSESEMVTEWHFKRIFFALSLILGFILIGILFLIGTFDITESEKNIKSHNKPAQKKINSNARIKPKPELNKLKPLITEIKPDSTPLSNTLITDPSANTKIIKSPVNKNTPINPIDNIEKTSTSEKEKNNPVVSDARISKALITTEIKNKEPIDTITSPIRLNLDQVIEIHYYTEIMDMKGQTLSHHWLWGNQSIYVKKINVGGNRWRASTSKIIQYSKLGEWTVRLINDDNNIILNEIKFEIQKIKTNI